MLIYKLPENLLMSNIKHYLLLPFFPIALWINQCGSPSSQVCRLAEIFMNSAASDLGFRDGGCLEYFFHVTIVHMEQKLKSTKCKCPYLFHTYVFISLAKASYMAYSKLCFGKIKVCSTHNETIASVWHIVLLKENEELVLKFSPSQCYF